MLSIHTRSFHSQDASTSLPDPAGAKCHASARDQQVNMTAELQDAVSACLPLPLGPAIGAPPRATPHRWGWWAVLRWPRRRLPAVGQLGCASPAAAPASAGPKPRPGRAASGGAPAPGSRRMRSPSSAPRETPAHPAQHRSLCGAWVETRQKTVGGGEAMCRLRDSSCQHDTRLQEHGLFDSTWLCQSRLMQASQLHRFTLRTWRAHVSSSLQPARSPSDSARSMRRTA